MLELTEDEVKVVELYRRCENVQFYKHQCSFEEANSFASFNGESNIDESENASWIFSESRKIRVTGFLK